MENAAADTGLRNEIESAACCVANSYREMQQERRDYMRRMALMHTNSQAIESMISLWIERAQREARHV